MAVTKQRPPAITAEPTPSPSLADHATLFSNENSTGSDFDSVDTPLEFSPRNCGQSSARADSRAAPITMIDKNKVAGRKPFMPDPLGCRERSVHHKWREGARQTAATCSRFGGC